MTAPACIRSSGFADHERCQTVLTPRCIIDALAEFWPCGIDLDPCSAEGSLVEANLKYFGDEHDDGLREPWIGRCYVNPPFADLRAWLEKAKQEAVACEIALLCPARVHRVWFRAAMRNASATVLLNSLAFHGHTSTFPQALALLYWGPRVEAFTLAFAHLGDPLSDFIREVAP